MKRILILLSLFLCCYSCVDPIDQPGQEEPEKTELSLADPQASLETKALYSNLWAIQEKGFMFGHHDDLVYGRYWYDVPGRSDTKDVCGDYPAVFSVDLAECVDNRTDAALSDEAKIKLRSIKEAYDRGMVIVSCLHLNNPLTGGDSWDNSNPNVALEILEEGSSTNIKFKQWLDRLAALALTLKGSDGKTIPIILRPFHEHTQDWPWWGNRCTSEKQFIDLWRYTISYLRDTKGVHSFIYAISPQMDSAKTVDDFYFRWPGDEWVDFIGMDCYQGINNAVFVANLKAISAVSTAKQKPVGVTETGVEGFKTKDYWTVNIHAPLTGRRVSMVITWRNKFVGMNDSDKHYFSVFKGHPSEDDFLKMYKEPNSFFCSDLPDMYTMAKNVIVN